MECLFAGCELTPHPANQYGGNCRIFQRIFMKLPLFPIFLEKADGLSRVNAVGNVVYAHRSRNTRILRFNPKQIDAGDLHQLPNYG
jgi:hypothetical protein